MLYSSHAYKTARNIKLDAVHQAYDTCCVYEVCCDADASATPDSVQNLSGRFPTLADDIKIQMFEIGTGTLAGYQASLECARMSSINMFGLDIATRFAAALSSMLGWLEC